MRWAGYVAQMGNWEKSQKLKDHWEEQDVDDWRLLKWILQRYDEVMWIASIWLSTTFSLNM
jgi:hypothetical protein